MLSYSFQGFDCRTELQWNPPPTPRLLLRTWELRKTPFVTSQGEQASDILGTHRRVSVLGQDSSDDRSLLSVWSHHALVEVLGEHR